MKSIGQSLVAACMLLVGSTSPSQAVTSNCPEYIAGISAHGGCSFVCLLTAIVFFRDPQTGEITYECEYDDCFSSCN